MEGLDSCPLGLLLHWCVDVWWMDGEAPSYSQDGGKAVGTLRVVEQNCALAHVRLQPAMLAMEGKGVLVVEGTDVVVQPLRPSWWPASWGKEEG